MSYLSNGVVVIDYSKMSEDSIRVINIEVNGVHYAISNTNPKTSLNEWLRSQPGLKGDAHNFYMLGILLPGLFANQRPLEFICLVTFSLCFTIYSAH